MLYVRSGFCRPCQRFHLIRGCKIYLTYLHSLCISRLENFILWIMMWRIWSNKLGMPVGCAKMWRRFVEIRRIPFILQHLSLTLSHHPPHQSDTCDKGKQSKKEKSVRSRNAVNSDKSIQGSMPVLPGFVKLWYEVSSMEKNPSAPRSAFESSVWSFFLPHS